MSADNRIQKHIMQIIDNFYIWSETAVERVANRLVSGDELTMNFDRKEAWINYYIGDNPERISWNYAEMVTKTGILQCHSGNYETSERHYNINFR